MCACPGAVRAHHESRPPELRVMWPDMTCHPVFNRFLNVGFHFCFENNLNRNYVNFRSCDSWPELAAQRSVYAMACEILHRVRGHLFLSLQTDVPKCSPHLQSFTIRFHTIIQCITTIDSQKITKKTDCKLYSSYLASYHVMLRRR